MRVRPISPENLAAELAERIAAGPRGRFRRVAVDGAPAARPADLADALAERLRAYGLDTVRVSAGGYLRPASLRLEFGREDPDVFFEDWLDEKGLLREVLAPLGEGGSGEVLPALWDAGRDRATRSPYVTLAPGGVLLLDGPLLLGRGLPLDLTVHLGMSAPALSRRTTAGEAWTLPAYARYEAEVAPREAADVVVTVDDPRHPALVERS